MLVNRRSPNRKHDRSGSNAAARGKITRISASSVTYQCFWDRVQAAHPSCDAGLFRAGTKNVPFVAGSTSLAKSDCT